MEELKKKKSPVTQYRETENKDKMQPKMENEMRRSKICLKF